jgi:hypothetical protein
MPGTNEASPRVARLGRFAWLVFGFSVLFLAVLGVTRARGSEVSWTVWALALLNIINATSGLPGLSIRISRALTMLSFGVLLATVALMVSSLLQ